MSSYGTRHSTRTPLEKAADAVERARKQAEAAQRRVKDAEAAMREAEADRKYLQCGDKSATKVRCHREAFWIVAPEIDAEGDPVCGIHLQLALRRYITMNKVAIVRHRELSK